MYKSVPVTKVFQRSCNGKSCWRRAAVAPVSGHPLILAFFEFCLCMFAAAGYAWVCICDPRGNVRTIFAVSTRRLNKNPLMPKCVSGTGHQSVCLEQGIASACWHLLLKSFPCCRIVSSQVCCASVVPADPSGNHRTHCAALKIRCCCWVVSVNVREEPLVFPFEGFFFPSLFRGNLGQSNEFPL